MEQFIDGPLGKVCFAVLGSGIPLVLLHGFGANKQVFIDFKLDDYQIIIPDLPGSGKSDFKGDAHIFNVAKTVVTILDFLAIERAIFIGHSMGGYVGLSLLDNFSTRVTALGLVHSSPFADSTERKQKRLQIIEYLNENGAMNFLGKFIPSLFFENQKANNALLIKDLLLAVINQSTEGLIWQTKAMMQRVDYSNLWKTTQIPLLTIIGKEDPIIDWHTALGFASHMQIGSLHILPSVGHMLPFEDAETFSNIIRSFLIFADSIKK